MRVNFVSREHAINYIQSNYLFSRNYSLISVSDSQSEKKAIRKLWKAHNKDGSAYARFYTFLDVDDPAGRLTEEKATSIVTFISNTTKARKNLLTHCWLGVSRSAAIAKFAQDYYGFENPALEQYPLYNRYVYSQLLDVIGSNGYG